MAENSAISWTDHTFNPWIGCTKVGPACDGCYAEALMGDTGRYKRVTWGKPGQRATHARTSESTWAQPRKWDKKAKERFEATGERTFVFCASLADVFDKDVPIEWRADLFALIRATPNLTWLLLTKRPQNIVGLYLEAHPSYDPKFPSFFWPRNAAIGCTVVTQAEADRDIPRLLLAKRMLKPAFAFLSMEPLLGPVDLSTITLRPNGGRTTEMSQQMGDYILPLSGAFTDSPTIDWVITGGETSQGAHKSRPSHPEWFRSLRDQCAAAGVAYHHKQNGEWAPLAVVDPDGLTKGDDVTVWPDGSIGDGDHMQNGGYGSIQRKVGKKAAGRLLDGVEHDARPEVRS